VLSKRKVCEVCERQTDRQTNITNMKHFHWWNVFKCKYIMR